MDKALIYRQLDTLVRTTRQHPSPFGFFLERLRTQAGVVRQFRNWPVVFLDYFNCLRSPTAIYTLRSGIRFTIRCGTTDRGILNEIWVRREYLPPGFAIAPADVVVDIGGQLGAFTVQAAKRATAGIVIVYEPTTANHGMLIENLQLNQLTNVRVHQKAVAGQDGRATIYLSGTNTGGHSLSQELADGPASETVATVSLSTVFAENSLDHIDLLKVDCEGGEYAIFRQCPDAVFAGIRKIAMECHDIDEIDNRLTLKQLLEQKGFRVWLNRRLLYALNTREK